MAESGAGKSTLMSILCGLIKPVSGEILVDNVKIDQSAIKWMKKFGIVPQNFLCWMTPLKITSHLVKARIV